jgi:hypothetical protein
MCSAIGRDKLMKTSTEMGADLRSYVCCFWNWKVELGPSPLAVCVGGGYKMTCTADPISPVSHADDGAIHAKHTGGSPSRSRPWPASRAPGTGSLRPTPCTGLFSAPRSPQHVGQLDTTDLAKNRASKHPSPPNAASRMIAYHQILAEHRVEHLKCHLVNGLALHHPPSLCARHGMVLPDDWLTDN